MAKPLTTVEVLPRPKPIIRAYSVERSGQDWVLMENKVQGDKVLARHELARDIRRVCIRKAEVQFSGSEE